jgi:hypothetical protein
VFVSACVEVGELMNCIDLFFFCFSFSFLFFLFYSDMLDGRCKQCSFSSAGSADCV